MLGYDSTPRLKIEITPASDDQDRDHPREDRVVDEESGHGGRVLSLAGSRRAFLRGLGAGAGAAAGALLRIGLPRHRLGRLRRISRAARRRR